MLQYMALTKYPYLFGQATRDRPFMSQKIKWEKDRCTKSGQHAVCLSKGRI